MGTPVIEPPEYGDDCPACTPSLFPIGETPRFVFMTVSGIITCPGAPYPAPNGEWVLEQWIGNPCHWSLVSGPYNLGWWMVPTMNSTGCQLTGGPSNYFLYFGTPVCQTVLANQYLACTGAPRGGKLGTVTITW